MSQAPVTLKIKIPQQSKESYKDLPYPERLPYPVLVEYAKKFKTHAEIDAEISKMLIVLQQTEREKAKHKSKDSLDVYSVKLTRFTQLFKTLLAIKATWPTIHIPRYLSADPSF
jgi:hypothetical protein